MHVRPAMIFKTTAVRKTGEKTYEITGAADFGRGRRCGFETTFTIGRSNSGVMYGVESGALGDEIRIIISLEGTKND